MSKSAKSESMADPRERIVDATMALVAERDWNSLELTDIAERAGVSLLVLRDAFPSKGAILGGFLRLIDRKVLAESADDLAGEPAKDRLFDVLMRRLDALGPYKESIRKLRPALMRDPAALFALNGLALNSHRYSLAAAHIPASGPLGALRMQGLAIGFSRVIDVWLHDETPDQSKTLAAMDKMLTRGGQMLDRAEDVMRLTAPLRAFCSGLRDVRRGLKSRAEERRDSRRQKDRDGDYRDDPVAV